MCSLTPSGARSVRAVWKGSTHTCLKLPRGPVHTLVCCPVWHSWCVLVGVAQPGIVHVDVGGEKGGVGREGVWSLLFEGVPISLEWLTLRACASTMDDIFLPRPPTHTHTAQTDGAAGTHTHTHSQKCSAIAPGWRRRFLLWLRCVWTTELCFRIFSVFYLLCYFHDFWDYCHAIISVQLLTSWVCPLLAV